MLKLRILATTAVFIAAIGVITNFGHGQRIVDDDTYNRMVTIKGHVEILNNPVLGRTPGSGMFLVFQREGCKNCLVGTFADAKGNYSIRVGLGRYKLIVYNPSPPTYDLIAPDQSRYVDAYPKLQDTEFDIKLVVPGSR